MRIVVELLPSLASTLTGSSSSLEIYEKSFLIVTILLTLYLEVSDE